MREGVKLSVIRPDRSRGRQQVQVERQRAEGRAEGLRAELGGCAAQKVKGQLAPLFSGPPCPSTCSVSFWWSMERS